MSLLSKKFQTNEMKVSTNTKRSTESHDRLEFKKTSFNNSPRTLLKKKQKQTEQRNYLKQSDQTLQSSAATKKDKKAYSIMTRTLHESRN